MNKIRFLVLMCILEVAGIVNAQQQVSEIEARNAAINTLYNKAGVLKVSSDDRIKTVNSLNNANGDTIMYEMVFQNGAAVLLSGSKTCLPVLGFYVKDDNNAVFDPNNDDVPCGLKALLKGYADDIEWGFAQDTICLHHKEKWQELQQFSKGAAPPFVYVDTLLTTKWGQDVSNKGSDCPAYNYYVKTTNRCQSCGNHCRAGCTAVAMGQIMKYWNYPVYLPDNNYQYDWCNMPDSLITMFQVNCRDTLEYHPPNNHFPNGYWSIHEICDKIPNPNYENERHAIARLLKDCGKAMNADYCISKCATSATAIDARRVLVHKFDYSNDAVFRLRSSHPINYSNVWIDYLRTNLNAGRPVLYGALGQDAHYWVCDGYGDDGGGNSHEHVYFHFNFGHRGKHDGWYTVDNITANPHWNNLQEAVFNIYPSTNENYYNYTFSLDDHFASGGTHQNVPQTFMKLETASESSPSAWRTIQSGQIAEYVTHESIRLLPGFKAESGAHFTARIKPCPNCNSARVTLKSLSNGVEIEEDLYIAVGDDESEQPSGEAKTTADEPQVYPNPTTGLLTINTQNDNSRIQMIELYNTQGVKLFTFSGNQGYFQEIDISHLPSQVYVLKVHVNGQVFTKKLILQK